MAVCHVWPLLPASAFPSPANSEVQTSDLSPRRPAGEKPHPCSFLSQDPLSLLSMDLRERRPSFLLRLATARFQSKPEVCSKA